MDRRTPYSLSLITPKFQGGAEETRTDIQAQLREFILEFQLDNSFVYRWEIAVSDCPWVVIGFLANWVFRDQLRQNVLVKRFFCDVDVAHLIAYNEELAHRLTSSPQDTIPLVSNGMCETLQWGVPLPNSSVLVN
jgi:DNA replication licensing factor MCM5